MNEWQLHDRRATLRGPSFSATVDLANPASGWQQVLAQSCAIAGKFLSLRSPRGLFGEQERLTETYVRGSDLIATYEERPERPLRPQVYWRTLDEAAAPSGAGIEVIFSMQTHLLDSDPGIVCETELAVDQVLALPNGGAGFQIVPDQGAQDRPLDAGTILFRITGEALTFATLVHPGDWLGGTIATRRVAQDRGIARHQFLLFGERLEKGVIRRVRLRGLFLPRERDEELALAAAASFAASRLPLTT